MIRYPLPYKNFIFRNIFKSPPYHLPVISFSKSNTLESEAKQGGDNPYTCCLPYLPQCPPAIPDCEPCPSSCPPCPPKRENVFLKNLIVQALKALILGATLLWTVSEGVWGHPSTTDRTFRRWYGQVFGSPTPEACICDEKKHIPTHEEISYRVTQTYYGITAGTFKGLVGALSKGDKKPDCTENALCPKA